VLGDASILICEDEPFIAMDLAMSVEEAGGRVLGPAASIREAMEILRFNKLTGAILDVNLADGVITPVVEQLLERSVPVVIQTGRPSFRALHPESGRLPVLQAGCARAADPRAGRSNGKG